MLTHLGYPSSSFQQGMNAVTPWVSEVLLGVGVQPPTDFTGSGDRLFNYCTSFAYLVLAASELWRRAGGVRTTTGRLP